MATLRADSVCGPIAVRRLLNPETGRLVVVRVYKPRPSRRAWVCRFDLSCRGDSRSGRAYGVDGLQALLLVYRAIRREVENRGYVWVGLPAELGFPRCADGVDLQTLRSAERAIDRTMRRWANNVAAKGCRVPKSR
jgi:hypothetical protein